MEEEHAKAPSHNNQEEAAEYVRSVNSLTDSFDMSIRGFDQPTSGCLADFHTRLIPASHPVGQRIFHQVGHRYHTRDHTRQSL